MIVDEISCDIDSIRRAMKNSKFISMQVLVVIKTKTTTSIIKITRCILLKSLLQKVSIHGITFRVNVCSD